MGWALALTLILALVACAAVVSSKQSGVGSFFKKVSPEQHQAAFKAEAQAAQAARLNKELAAAEEGGAGSAQGAVWKQHRPHNARRDKKARAQKAGGPPDDDWRYVIRKHSAWIRWDTLTPAQGALFDSKGALGATVAPQGSKKCRP